MTEMVAEIRRWLSGILELLLWLVGMLALLQVLFGDHAMQFLGIDVVGNIGSLVAKFGNAGLVGILAAALIAFLIVRSRTNNADDQPPQEVDRRY
jgi:vacuolar-type H+-ATPase subunit I/STV1